MTFANEGWTAVTREPFPRGTSDKQKTIVVVGALDASVRIDFINGKRTIATRTGARAQKVNPVDLGRRHNSSLQYIGN
jgi:hypothetical protein